MSISWINKKQKRLIDGTDGDKKINIPRSEVLKMLHLLQNDIDNLSVTTKRLNPNFIDPGTPHGKSCEMWFAELRDRIYMMDEALKK